MAIGDDAAAAGMALVDGATTDAKTIDTEINRTRDYIAQGMGATASNTPDKVVKRNASGNIAVSSPTASSHAATKQYVDSALGGKLDATEVYSGSGSVASKVPRYNSSGQLIAANPTADNHAASKQYVDAQTPPSFNGGTVTGQIYLPNSFAASSGYTIAYINGDGRISRGASSERYKDRITPIEALALGSIFPDLYEYVMRDDPDKIVRVGHIAERLHESPDLRRFVVYKSEPILDQPGSVAGYRLVLDEDGEPIPDSIDFIGLLLAQTAQLAARVAQLEARL